MQYLTNPVSRKIGMSLTGILMICFVFIHLLGNMAFFRGASGINAYAQFLHSTGPLLWAVRLMMLWALSIHVLYGVHLTLENRAAKPLPYSVGKTVRATAAGRSMIWTGLCIALYLAFHLLHFTLQILLPENAALRNPDLLGRPDVYQMLVRSFQQAGVAGLYIAAMAALGLHLSHGMQSMVQTLGLNNEKTLPWVVRAALAAAVLVFLAYSSIPAGVLSHLAGR